VRVDGTQFVVEGRTKPFKDSLETSFGLRFRDLDLTRYVPFVPVALPITIDSAKLTLALDVAFVRPRTDAPRLTVKGTVALTDLVTHEKRQGVAAPLVSLDRLAVDIGEADFTNQTFAVERVVVAGLDAHARRRRDGTLNFQHLGPSEPKPTSAAARGEVQVTPVARKVTEPAAPGPRFSLALFSLDGAAVHVVDESVTPAFASDVTGLHVSVRALSNAPGATAQLEAGLRAAPGGQLRQSGTLRLTPFAAAGKIEIDAIEPGRFAAYYHDAIAFDVAQGRLRVGTGYAVEGEAPHTTVRLENAFLELSDLALKRPRVRDPFFRLAFLGVRGGAIDLPRQTVHIGEIVARGGNARVARDAKGVVDLTTLVVPPPAAPVTSARPPLPKAAPKSAEKAAAPPWLVEVERLGLEKWGARFEDRAVTPAAVLTAEPIDVTVTSFSTAPGTKLGVDLRVGLNKTGRLQVAGTAMLDPFAADAKVTLRTLSLLPLQPYLRDQVNLAVSDGAVSFKGRAAIKMVEGGEPRVTLAADIDVADLATVDVANKDPLVAWKLVHIGGLEVATPPLSVSVKQLALTAPDAHIVVQRDGRLNLARAFAPPTDSSGTAAPEPKITVGEVSIAGGAVTFEDQTVHPSYAAEISELTGHIAGLSSTMGTTADVDLRGFVDRSAQLAISGKLNPLAKDLFVDMKFDLQDFELPPTSPYSGKFLGLTISKGKLDLTLDYKIAARKLDASNKINIDQLTFGDKVESPDAVKAPVRLAAAILKDRHGVIDLDIPIGGSLDDPNFKIWRAVVKVLLNLVAKAATAPFSLIASAFGGGDELSRIDFAPGLATLDPTASMRVTTLAKALRERPGISFELVGEVDPAQDRESLRRYLYERKLKKVKMDELVQAGAAVSSVDDLSIAPAEREHLVREAYDVARFPKPKNFLGLTKSLPVAEQENLILANTPVADDQLRDLALRRATAVQAALAKATPEAAHRLFLVSPRAAGKNRRVELNLKN
jgi:hypothetical protein